MDLLNILDRLDGCRIARLAASQGCLRAWQKILKIERKVSEAKFRNIWLKEMYKSKGIIPEGWYDPPLFGIAVLFADDANIKRVNYLTLRDKEYWPRADTYLKKDGTGYIFASPFMFIDDAPIIGDFGMSFYLGKNQKIIDYFKKCYQVQNDLISLISLNMTFSQIYEKSIEIISKNGLENNVYSTTDKSRTDIGHTIPFIDRNLNTEERNGILSEDSDKIHKVMSQGRVFINKNSDYKLTENCAFTVEPRFTSISNPKLPMCSFHTIIEFIHGKKVILQNFDGIFNLLGMDWIKK